MNSINLISKPLLSTTMSAEIAQASDISSYISSFVDNYELSVYTQSSILSVKNLETVKLKITFEDDTITPMNLYMIKEK